MSYDIWLEADLGGDKPITIDWGLNHTSNTSRMWSEAGADLAEMDGKLAGDCIAALETAISDLQGRPEHFNAMAPLSGWGTRESCIGFLVKVLDMFRAAPLAKVVVSR